MDLTTQYMGLSLKNPLVLGASPLSNDIGMLKQLEDKGVAAIVSHSIFEEQIRHEQLEADHYMEMGTESYREALSYFPEPQDFQTGPDKYLENISKAKEALDIPVIGSLNGTTKGGWIEFAKRIQEAGADALEMNIYQLATDPNQSGDEVEQIYLDILKEVKSQIRIPVALKLSPYFSSMANMAKKLDEAGADALVLFNRFYQPDIDLEELAVKPSLVLSTSDELRLPLRWIAILYGHIKCSMALTSGVHTAADVAKAVLAGADIAMMTSAILMKGPALIPGLLKGMDNWMAENEYESVAQMKGALSQKSCPQPAAFERANYMKTLQSWSSPV